MLGTYRFLLATFVIFGHLAIGWFSPLGVYSVRSFYIISGYLMTMILQERYGFTIRGFGKYLVNRFLRIYPVYWIVVAATIVIMISYPWIMFLLQKSILMPDSTIDWIRNFAIFGLAKSNVIRFIPQAWSLDAELWFYILMGLFLSRSRFISVLWLVITLVCEIADIAVLDGGIRRAIPLMKSSLPFALGANIWWFRDRLASVPRWGFPALLLLFLANVLAYHQFHIDRTIEGYYVNVLISAFILIAIVKADSPGFMKRWASIDSKLGDLSYPMYISHYFVAAIMSLSFFSLTYRHRGLWYFVVAYSYTIIFSYILHILVEKRINRIRDRIKRRISNDPVSV